MTTLLLFVLLQAPQAAPQIVPPNAVQEDYHIGVSDVLDITVFNEPDASRAGVTVDNDGTIDVAYIGRVHVAGRTARDIEREIRSRLNEKYLVNPSVNVTIVKYQSKTVTVQGYVRNPAEYILQGNVSLTSVLARAGSLTMDAGSYVLISRAGANGATEQVRVSRKDIETGKAQNVYLKDGDTVLVPKAETVLVAGYVRAPGAIAWEEGLTVERAIILAGGPTERGAANRAEVDRVVNGKVQKVKVKAGDPVQANDTIRVPARIW